MAVSVDYSMGRFIRAMMNQEGAHKLEAIRSKVPKDDFMAWKDAMGLDILHHAILLNYPDGVDFLLTRGYFAEPYEPQINLYAHLAARMGYKTCLYVVLKHRPGDFKVAKQSLSIPRLTIPIWEMIFKNGEDVMPGMLGESSGCSSGQTFTVKKVEESLLLPGIRIKAMGSFPKAITDSEKPPPVSPRKPCTKGRTRSASVPEQYLAVRKAEQTEAASGSQSTSNSPFCPTKALNQTPLQVAAHAVYPACVKLVLDMCIRPKYPDLPCCTGYLTLAVLADCPPALKLLLSMQSRLGSSASEEWRRKEDFREAVKCALRAPNRDCLNLLLADSSVNVRDLVRAHK